MSLSSYTYTYMGIYLLWHYYYYVSYNNDFVNSWSIKIHVMYIEIIKEYLKNLNWFLFSEFVLYSKVNHIKGKTKTILRVSLKTFPIFAQLHYWNSNEANIIMKFLKYIIDQTLR